MNEKQFLKGLRKAMGEMECKTMLENGHRLRFILRRDKGRCPITLLCIFRKGIYYDPSYEVKKAARLVGIPAKLREKINRAADRHPWGYDRGLRRQLMRAAGRWT